MADILMVHLNGVEIFTAHLPDGPPRTNPLGILSLVATCEREGISVVFRTFTLDWFHRRPDDVERLIACLEGDSPIIGIGSDSSFMPFLLTALPRIRAAFPKRRIVLGGYGPTHAADAIMPEFPEIDAVICGEAERTLPEVVRRLLHGVSLEGLPGVRYRDGETVCGQGLGERIKDLDTLPLTPWHLVDMNAIDDATLMTSRGCPYPCPYCSIRTVWQARTINFSLDRTMEEIARVRLDYGKTSIRFFDDTFVLNRRRTLDFCRRLQSEGLDIDWFCYARIDRIDEELLEAMAASGCTRIRFGVESMSDAVLAEIKGGYDGATARERLRMCARYIRNIEVNFMYGFPFERWDDFRQTLSVAMDLVEDEIARVSWGRLVLYPLTPMYERYRDQMVLDPATIPPDFRGEFKMMGDFVRSHPDLCTYYYTVPSPDLARKEAAVEDFTRWYYRGGQSRLLSQARLAHAAPLAAKVPAMPRLRARPALSRSSASLRGGSPPPRGEG